MSTRLILCLVFLVGLQTAILHGQQAQNAHDGYWWTNSSEGFRVGFVSGYTMAMNFAGEDAALRCLAQKSGGKVPATLPDQAVLKACVESPEAKPYVTYGGNFVVGQWSDGVDEFYKDFRNKRLDIQLAMRYVGQQLSGIPAKELEDEVTGWRRAAAK